MDRSKYIARLMGPVMLIIGIGMIGGMLTQGDDYSSLLKEFIGSRALIFITGVLALVAGLAVVNEHNLWVRDWFPWTVQTLGDRMIASHGGVLAGAAATIALGAILSIMGYEHLWNETPHRQSAARAASATKRPSRKRA
jgi:hypothetical protein